MIINYLVSFLTSIIGIVFSWLPHVDTLPVFMGYDIDAALVSGMGTLYAFADAVWPIKYVLVGLLILMSYYSFKLVLTFIFGNRAPH